MTNDDSTLEPPTTLLPLQPDGWLDIKFRSWPWPYEEDDDDLAATSNMKRIHLRDIRSWRWDTTPQWVGPRTTDVEDRFVDYMTIYWKDGTRSHFPHSNIAGVHVHGNSQDYIARQREVRRSMVNDHKGSVQDLVGTGRVTSPTPSEPVIGGDITDIFPDPPSAISPGEGGFFRKNWERLQQAVAPERLWGRPPGNYDVTFEELYPHGILGMER